MSAVYGQSRLGSIVKRRFYCHNAGNGDFFTPYAYQIRVPESCNYIYAYVWGGGGSGNACTESVPKCAGAGGGYAEGLYPVRPGELLRIIVSGESYPGTTVQSISALAQGGTSYIIKGGPITLLQATGGGYQPDNAPLNYVALGGMGYGGQINYKGGDAIGNAGLTDYAGGGGGSAAGPWGNGNSGGLAVAQSGGGGGGGIGSPGLNAYAAGGPIVPEGGGGGSGIGYFYDNTTTSNFYGNGVQTTGPGQQAPNIVLASALDCFDPNKQGGSGGSYRGTNSLDGGPGGGGGGLYPTNTTPIRGGNGGMFAGGAGAAFISTTVNSFGGSGGIGGGGGGANRFPAVAAGSTISGAVSHGGPGLVLIDFFLGG